METLHHQEAVSLDFHVSTLPIRNGNSIALMIRHILSALLLLSEYLTYEEWKRYSCSYYLLVLKPETSEYLTYKEWKLWY